MICNICKIDKLPTVENFYKKKYGLDKRCKVCLSEQSKKRYLENHTSELLRNREKYSRRTRDERDHYLELGRLWIKTDNGIYARYKKESTRRNKLFDISKEDFIRIINSPCFYCGMNSRGVDRVENSVGYQLSNCVPCCKICNRMKNNQTLEEFYERCKRIVDHTPFPSIEEVIQTQLGRKKI